MNGAKYWWALPLVCALVWGIRMDSLRASYKAKWQDVSAEYAAFETAVIDKTAEALAAQRAVNAAKEAAYQEKAREAEEEIAGLRGDLRAAVLRYAKDNPGGGGSCAAAQGDDPRISEGPAAQAGPPETLTITLEDALTVADLYAYAAQAHDWATSLEN
ncbi:MAG: hypothetical protein AB7E05_14290 [Sphingobium sp.]